MAILIAYRFRMSASHGSTLYRHKCKCKVVQRHSGSPAEVSESFLRQSCKHITRAHNELSMYAPWSCCRESRLFHLWTSRFLSLLSCIVYFRLHYSTTVTCLVRWTRSALTWKIISRRPRKQSRNLRWNYKVQFYVSWLIYGWI